MRLTEAADAEALRAEARRESAENGALGASVARPRETVGR